MARKQKPRYETFRLVDRTNTIQHPLLVAGESFQAYRVVYQDRHQFENKVCDHTVLYAHVAENLEASCKENTIYYKQPSSPELLTALFNSLRDIALKGDATPEAIRLLGSVEPWTTREERIMAEKLKAKASAAKPDKEGLKTAAKAAPVGGNKTSPKNKGNAAALAKARAAKATGPDTRKVKALVKVKDLKARAGTFRRQMLEDLLGSKTVQEFRDKDSKYNAACVAWAQKEGFVQYS